VILGAGFRKALPLIFLAWIAAVAAPIIPAVADDGMKRLVGRGYASVRRELVREGYRPLRLKHDGYDVCWYGEARICRRYPEALLCDGTPIEWCTFIFERPEGRSHRASRYLIVRAEGEQPNPDVTRISPPTREDMDDFRARRNLAKYCELNLLGLSRPCPESEDPLPPSTSDEDSSARSNKAPVMPDLPPLPPSAR
jgi:hypothetical protein